MNINTIANHQIDRPPHRTPIGSPEEFDALSPEFKDQIKFLNEEAGTFLYQYIDAAKFVTGRLWNPFDQNNFKTIEKYTDFEDDKQLKKWLYHRGIPFSKWVFLLPNYGEPPMMLTWKMVIKQADRIFFSDDIVLFDETNQWCILYWHEEELFFGKTYAFSEEQGYKEMEELDARAKQYPGFKNPYR